MSPTKRTTSPDPARTDDELGPALAAGGWAAATFRRGVPAKYQRASLDAFVALGGDEATLAQLVGWAQRQGRRWLYLHGRPGVGKTSLAVALAAHLALSQERRPYFAQVGRLLDEVRGRIAEGAGSQADVFDALAAVDLLILDDLGREQLTEWVRERLFRLIAARHDDERQTILTSNYGLGSLRTRLGDALVWRIAESSQVVHVTGPNLRAVVAERAS